ncbi:Acg family FMN-binding oxidoreductase [Amycolatopsis anabasis]|uniref:Acg family FMN-binding oxidoreductase n=1 Tax=Amycolatopsis anabasis TaxID=1840409 RepID=UPI00131C1EBC|nr:nitroreductase family protein [Amycolatopsis anabasis]
MTWSSAEVGVLVRAVNRAPSVHNSQPWTLEAHANSADLYERFESSLPRHDPTGRDRLVSCGAALTNLELAVRALGWDAVVSLFPEPGHPDLVARVRGTTRKEATLAEVDRYSAIFQRRSYRQPFSPARISRRHLRRLARAVTEPGTQARVIEPRRESEPLADLLCHAATALRGDRAYQRELAAWLPHFQDPHDDGSTLPWAGLVRANTHLPDRITLTERLAREGLLILLTPDDGRRDHLLAGAAMEQIWLAALTEGLVASVLTQPLHVPEVRAGLIEHLGLAGFPQTILRVGYPVDSPTTAPRIPAAALPAHEEEPG